MDKMAKTAQGPLAGIRILDLTRIMAGPYCTQMLGDLGAEIIKVERPSSGDDTRGWGPPFLRNRGGQEISELSAYFLSVNRNKSSLALAMDTPPGQKILQALARKCDVVVENFKVGGLQKYGLDYPTLSQYHPELIYCAITGFGQTGPNRQKAGYDFIAQGISGMMSITGEAQGEPQKCGVAILDVVTGMYAATAILAALHARDRDGQGDYIDLSLADAGLASLINLGSSYLTTQDTPTRLGNAHAAIVPYQVFSCADGAVIITAGNDGQFARLCDYLECPKWAQDARFTTNAARVQNRAVLTEFLQEKLMTRTRHDIIMALEARSVPVGPVNTIAQALEDSQAKARDMRIKFPCPTPHDGTMEMVASPMKFTRNSVTYRKAPPQLGEDSHRILRDMLGLDDAQITALLADQIIGIAADMP
ncbi:MAG: CoA transferase [Pseudomonadota bacterium]